MEAAQSGRSSGFTNYNWLVFVYHRPTTSLMVFWYGFICTRKPAPRLAEVNTKRRSRCCIEKIDTRCCQMLCAGIIHDLSTSHVIDEMAGHYWFSTSGRSVIEQQCQYHSRCWMYASLSRFDRSLRKLRYGPEMWNLLTKNCSPIPFDRSLRGSQSEYCCGSSWNW